MLSVKPSFVVVSTGAQPVVRSSGTRLLLLSSMLAFAALGFVLAPSPSASPVHAQNDCDCDYEVAVALEECVPGVALWATCDPQEFGAEWFEAETTLCANFPWGLPATIQAKVISQPTYSGLISVVGTFTLDRVGSTDRYVGRVFLPSLGICHPVGDNLLHGVQFDYRLASGYWFNEEAILRVLCDSDLCY